MTETITVRGFIGNDIRHITTDKGLPISTFRLASTPRRYDRERGEWVDGETNWYTVTSFRALAQNVHSTLAKGDPVLVTGRLKVRQWSNDTGQRGTSVEIDADGVGHDLTFGTSSFTRLGGQQADSSAGWGAASGPTSPADPEQDLRALSAAAEEVEGSPSAWDGHDSEEEPVAAPF
ncbi:single-stranded DNA-binding protein [Nesterenkonia sp. PF2B19]|uniref:single-stranded DNA-binding protein n=1 Tax=unclassified Nesterenkonia TaxID=2629769 RepID=UPI0008723045|nr:single-stranded DNA-binding protein [Nesterenkonia sp. PF2B19]